MILKKLYEVGILLKYEGERKTRDDLLIAIILTVMTILGVSMILLNSNAPVYPHPNIAGFKNKFHKTMPMLFTRI